MEKMIGNMTSTTPHYDSQQPWNDLPKLPPKSEMESSVILKACIPARAELARINALVETLPNKAILFHAIPLQEARSSSEIENVVTTSDALYQAMASPDSGTDANTKEVLRYREALWEGVRHLEKKQGLDVALFEQICSRILNTQIQVRRDEEIHLGNAETKRITYTPPSREYLGDLLANLEHFIADDADGVDPLIKMAIMHYQFEAIHPFTDGNGRTGRVLNILYLMYRRLLSAPILFLSRFIIEHRGEYYQHLQDVTEKGQWQQWILYMLQAVEETSRDTAARVEAMRTLIDKISLAAQTGKARAAERDGFIEILFKWPYCKINIVQRELKCSRVTATRYLNEMTDLGILERIKRGRESYYINTELMNLLTD